jgi:hypothetical protein
MATNLIATQSIPRGLMRQSFAATMARLMPMGGAPLYGLSSLIPDASVLSFEHGYWTKIMAFPKVVAASGSAITITGNTVVLNITADAGGVLGANTNGSFLVAGDQMVDDTTYEQFRVISTTINDLGAGTLTLQRALSSTFITDSNTMVAVNNATDNKYPGISGGIAPLAAASGIPAATGVTTRAITLFHAGNAFEEASVRPTAVSLVAQRASNYTQIFRNSWAVSRTLAVSQLLAGNGAVQESKLDCGAFHALAIEKALFFGQKSLTTVNGQPFHTMDGIYNVINNNAPANISVLGAGAGGGTTWTDLEAALDKTLQVSGDPRGGNVRTLFVGGQVKRGLTDIARKNSNYNIEQDGSSMQLTEWGLEVSTLRTARGRFEIIEHPLLNAYGANSPLAKTAFVVDLGALKVGYLRKTQEDLYNQSGAQVDNSIDAQGGVLTTELTLEITNPGAFGVLKNINNVGLAG